MEQRYAAARHRHPPGTPAHARAPRRDPDYAAYDDTRGEVVLLCGLPASGKDTWARAHAAGRTVIALDAIRAELCVAPTNPHGPVVQAAKGRARALLQRGEPFIWNATNGTRALRRQLIDFCADYRTRVRVVRVEAPLAAALDRNARRASPVPERVILRMRARFEPPDPTEAHAVDHVANP